jgi:hypothetical protein
MLLRRTTPKQRAELSRAVCTSSQKPNWDVGAVAFMVLAGLDFWRGVPTRWPLGAYHVIAHCAVFIVVLAAYHIKTPLPAVRPHTRWIPMVHHPCWL